MLKCGEYSYRIEKKSLEAVADSEYSPFPPRIQSGPRGHLPIVGIRTPIARLGYSPPLSRHTPTRPRLVSFSLLYFTFRYATLHRR
ncbi:unnamed protein product [Callosobruchus maculatus]|uniref:Uncharacterized protein n=1 Tax=Callosobruchus maculatus TaxID=64391 RepID=A0A653CJ63_CALMS|nr:unnamed protein product [Callosobruchus maculatus]